MKRRDSSPRLKMFAHSMRGNATDAERRVWQVLRAGRMDGWHFRRQHPLGGYILDFYCDALGLAIELDGGQHFGVEAEARDLARTRALERIGVKVVRFSNYEALAATDDVLRSIAKVCRERGEELGVSASSRYLRRAERQLPLVHPDQPPPLPSPRGEGLKRPPPLPPPKGRDADHPLPYPPPGGRD